MEAGWCGLHIFGNGNKTATESCSDLPGICHVGVQFMMGTKFPLEGGEMPGEREHSPFVWPFPY